MYRCLYPVRVMSSASVMALRDGVYHAQDTGQDFSFSFCLVGSSLACGARGSPLLDSVREMRS